MTELELPGPTVVRCTVRGDCCGRTIAQFVECDGVEEVLYGRLAAGRADLYVRGRPIELADWQVHPPKRIMGIVLTGETLEGICRHCGRAYRLPDLLATGAAAIRSQRSSAKLRRASSTL